MTDPTLQAALEGDTPFLFGAVKIQFPSYTLRLLDGAGVIPITGDGTYTGEDDTYGSLDSIGSLNEDIGNEAPEIEISLLPPDSAAAATLSSASMQGSIVTIMVGAYDPVAGATIGQPEVLFLGEIDVPTLTWGENGRQGVSYTCVSVFERLFEVNEGARASDQFHQSIWPGELGFQYVTGAGKNLYWGGKRPVAQNFGYNSPPYQTPGYSKGFNYNTDEMPV